jgi:hypothetical protein
MTGAAAAAAATNGADGAKQLAVGFLGLGIMGEAMAANLLRSGKFSKVVVWNRTASKVRARVCGTAGHARLLGKPPTATGNQPGTLWRCNTLRLPPRDHRPSHRHPAV